MLPLGLTPQTRSIVFELAVADGFAWERLPDDLDLRSGPLRIR